MELARPRRMLLVAGLALASVTGGLIAIGLPNAQADEKPSSHANLVGGQPPGVDSSFIAQIQTPAGHCTAALIAPDALVTAWHCVSGQTDLSGETAAIGSQNLTADGTRVSLRGAPTQIAPPPPGYFGGADLAVVRLATPVQNQPVAIADTDPGLGTAVSNLGWDTGDTLLQELKGTVADCPQGWGGALCVSYAEGAHIEAGDSGGPLLVTGADGTPQLVGVVMGGEAAVPPTGAHEQVAKHKDEIMTAATQ